MTSIKTRILIPLGIVLFLLLAVPLLLLTRSQRTDMENYSLVETQQVDTLLDSLIDQEARLLSSHLDFLSNNTTLQMLFLARDREALLRETLKIYEPMNARYRITHWYFIDLDHTVFLRAHRPDDLGDQINRFTLLEAESTGQAAYGIELGRTFTLRLVVPWESNGQRIGYLELGMEIDHLTQRVHDSLGLDLFFVMDKQYLSRENWDIGFESLPQAGEWDQFEKIVVIDRTLDTIPAELPAAISAGSTYDITLEDYLYSANTLPLIDAGDRQIGFIVVFKDITNASSGLQRTSVILILFAAAVGGVLFIGFYAYINRIENQQRATLEQLQQASAEIEQRAAVEAQQRQRLEEINREVAERASAEQEQRERLQELVDQIRDVAGHLNIAAGDILAATHQQLTTMVHQDSAMTQTLSTVEQMRMTAGDAARQAQQVVESAHQSLSVSREGYEAIQNTINGIKLIHSRSKEIDRTMRALADYTQNIEDIIASVNELAEQSKLLALNANIEAARAGEHGRGFAVVANEVRQLAGQSREATDRVRTLLNEIRQSTFNAAKLTEEGSLNAEVGMRLAQNAGEAIQALTTVVEEAALTSERIAGVTQQQTGSMDQLVTVVKSIRNNATQAAASTRQTEQHARELNTLAEQMEKTVK